MEWGTVSGASILGMVFALIISVFLPITLCILIWKKTKAKVSVFFIGCVIFVIFALVLEQILHSIVLGVAGEILTNNVVLYGLYGGLAAALFEETGRLVAMKFFMKDNLNKGNALMYGAGHGGVEAMLLVGITSVSNLLTSFMINSGTIQASFSMLESDLQEATFTQLQALWQLPSYQFFMGGAERILAIVLQIGFSILVYQAVKKGQKKYFLAALFLHFAVDFVTVLMSGYGMPIWGIELVLLVMTAGVAVLTAKIYQGDAI